MMTPLPHVAVKVPPREKEIQFRGPQGPCVPSGILGSRRQRRVKSCCREGAGRDVGGRVLVFDGGGGGRGMVLCVCEVLRREAGRLGMVDGMCC